MSKQQQKYFIKTYGCQANKNESERLATFFEQEKEMEATNDWRKADLILLNTCSVRKAADDRVFGLLRELNKYFLGESGGKRIARERIGRRKTSSKSSSKSHVPQVILTGCMSRYEFVKLKARYPILTEIWEPGKIGFEYAPKRKDQTQAFIQISTGCNSFCTYCVVPYARGREKSRSREDILQEVKQAVTDGYSEITLLGQNVNSWGLEKIAVVARKNNLATQKVRKIEDLPSNLSQYVNPDEKGGVPFVKLLQEISLIPEIKKIRFMTSNPWDFYDELIEEIGRNQKIDAFIHLPVQSGSDSVLRRMNRGYGREDYLGLIRKLRQVRPDIQIGTDIIVGFSGETEEEFTETVKLVEEADFVVAFVAIYSVRPGTVASKIYKDDVPFSEKKRRWEILDQMINKDQLSKRPRIV